MKSDPKCLFCAIAQKNLPSHIVFEDDSTVAFLDVHPRTPGHCMVISKYHAKTLEELPPEEASRLFLAVQKVARAVKAATHADALTIGINNGRVSGQEVDHLHVHILSRFAGDGGASIQSLVLNDPNIPPSDMVEIIRNTI